ncbi:MAG TPA: porphobilinogen synthase [Candidatus Binatia bacterium]|nr:porphobilinogen synthase [Candidatus Binatia bacterium]
MKNVGELVRRKVDTSYIVERPRRLRASAAMRDLVRENRINPEGFIQPLFVVPGSRVRQPIASMPGIERLSIDETVRECRELASLGLRAVLLFGVPDEKDAMASLNYDPNGLVQRAAREIKSALPELIVAADLCNCEYTDHGHCGILDERGDVDNDRTLEVLVLAALTYARAGVDIIAPSDMMDGRVGAIRRALDADGYYRSTIMSYASKYASAFYGPFRDAADSTPAFGDRRTYQMDPANAREALREALLDIDEGADIVMVKPALAYMDIIRQVRDAVDRPVATYNVSGEYAMVKAAAERGWIEESKIVDEMLVGFARAGADIVITYFAKDYLRRHGA